MRKTTACLAAMAILVIWLTRWGPALAGDAPAADATGSWKWTIQTPDGDSINMSAKLTQDGQKLSGIFVDGFDQKAFDIRDGKVKDGNVSFTVIRPFNDDTITVNYDGKLNGDTIKGTLEVKFGDQDPTKSDWAAKRSADDASTTQPTTQP
ncbi:MAG: hypothetical protein ABSB33_07780 [Tepidisphaeraceae bacterium]|jgi:hypothetical protein